MYWGGWVRVEGGVCGSTQGPPSLHVQVAEAVLPCLCRRRLLMLADCIRRRPFMQRWISGGFRGFSAALVEPGGGAAARRERAGAEQNRERKGACAQGDRLDVNGY